MQLLKWLSPFSLGFSHGSGPAFRPQVLSPNMGCTSRCLAPLDPTGTTHLLTFGALEVHVAVALPALGRRAELPKPVGPGRLGQPHVAEGPAGHGHRQLWGHAVEVSW